MSCKNIWEQELAGRLEWTTRVAAAQVDGGWRCDHAGCTALVNRATNACVRGHAQGSSAPTYQAEVGALLCLTEELEQRDLLRRGFTKKRRRLIRDYPAGITGEVGPLGEDGLGDVLTVVGRVIRTLRAEPAAALDGDPRLQVARAAYRLGVWTKLEALWRARATDLPLPAMSEELPSDPTAAAPVAQAAVRAATGVDSFTVTVRDGELCLGIGTEQDWGLGARAHTAVEQAGYDRLGLRPAAGENRIGPGCAINPGEWGTTWGPRLRAAARQRLAYQADPLATAPPYLCVVLQQALGVYRRTGDIILATRDSLGFGIGARRAVEMERWLDAISHPLAWRTGWTRDEARFKLLVRELAGERVDYDS